MRHRKGRKITTSEYCHKKKLLLLLWRYNRLVFIKYKYNENQNNHQGTCFHACPVIW